VIRCQHILFWFICAKVQIKNQGMFLALVNCFLDANISLLVLGTMLRKVEKNWRKSWLSSAKLAPACGAPDSVQCPGWSGDELVTLGNSPRMPQLKFIGLSVVHRTVRCASDCSVSQQRPRPTVGSMINEQHMAEPTVGWSHWTVRCANGIEGPTVGYA
jgi:hypothetical protein